MKQKKMRILRKVLQKNSLQKKMLWIWKQFVRQWKKNCKVQMNLERHGRFMCIV